MTRAASRSAAAGSDRVEEEVGGDDQVEVAVGEGECARQGFEEADVREAGRVRAPPRSAR